MIFGSVRKSFLKLVCAAVALIIIFPLLAQAADSPKGIWVIGDGKARIKLEACDEGLCGTLVWLAEPLDPKTHEPARDDNNPDPSLRMRPIIGLQILKLKPDGNQHWSGTIYNAQDGRNYDSTLKIDGDNLDLRGCILDMLCRTQKWFPYRE